MGKYCFTCGGFGFEDKVCPECGHEPLNKTLDLDKVKNVSEFVKKIDNTEIPAKYHGIFWSREILERDNQDKLSHDANGASDKLFTWYCDQLQIINDVFANNRIPHKSAIIIAPAGYSKITFAYSCMQRALNAGFTVAPLPTVYKLKSLGMDTVTLGVDCRGDTKSVKTIIAYLHNVGFLPCADSKLFDNVFESICKAVDEVFAERTIDDFIAERMLIFISALVKEGYDVSVLQQLNVRDISFPVIVNVLGITDVKRLAHLFMAFTQRFYGAALPMRQNYDLIRRWLNGSV